MVLKEANLYAFHFDTEKQSQLAVSPVSSLFC